MEDETGVPPRVFRFAPREFVRANRPLGDSVQQAQVADPGVNPNSNSETPIDVRNIIRDALGDTQWGETGPIRCENEVHGILRMNVESDRARGWYDVEPGKDRKRRRRIRNYVIALVAINAPLGLIAWTSGHTSPFPFVFAVAGMAYLSARVTWEAWFLRTD